jgi:hypothetical protein
MFERGDQLGNAHPVVERFLPVNVREACRETSIYPEPIVPRQAARLVSTGQQLSRDWLVRFLKHRIAG